MAVELLPKILPNILFRTAGKSGVAGLTGLFKYRAGDTLPAGVSFTGPAGRTYIDASGTRQTVGANVLRDAHFIGGVRSVLLEGARTNHFLNSAAPVTQTTPSLATGTYTLWMTGAGSVTVSAGTATITGAGAAVAGTPVVFAVTVAGTVTYTVAGGPTLVQAELGGFASSYIATAGAAVTRTRESLTFPVGFPEQELTMYVKYVDQGSQAGSWGVLALGDFGVKPSLYLFHPISTVLRNTFHNGTAGLTSDSNPSGIVLGNTVEAKATLTAAGVSQIGVSRNGAAEALGAATAGQALGTGWGGSALLVNNYNAGTPQDGFAAFQSIKIAAGIRSLSDMRNF